MIHGVGGDRFSYEKLIEYYYGQGYQCVCWDFRGLFRSTSPTSHGRFAVRDSAEDLLAVMDALKIDKAHVMIGWSTGVQIGLEFACMYPERVENLIVANGSHGQAFHTGWPVRIPYFSHGMHLFLRMMLYLNRTFIYEVFVNLYKSMRPLLRVWYFLYAFLFGNPALFYHFERYQNNVFLNGRAHLLNYLQYFQQLDAHSVVHVLDRVQVHTLCVSAFFDMLTPPYGLWEVSSRMPNCEHVHFLTATHFVPLEYGDALIAEMKRFVK